MYGSMKKDMCSDEHMIVALAQNNWWNEEYFITPVEAGNLCLYI